MRIAVLTANAVRHKYIANTLIKNADKALVVSECGRNDAFETERLKNSPSPLEAHFYQRYKTEEEFFSGEDFFISDTVPLLRGEVNLRYTFETIKGFKPDMMVCFGASLIKEPLLSLLKPGRFINLHLGLSPYYRGSGTNFWPFVNGELEYVGSTLLHIDAGVDTGDIIAHIRPELRQGDDVHIAGCRVIKESARALTEVMRMIKEGKKLNRVKQWKVPGARYYRSGDFNEDILKRYKDNLANGLVERYLRQPKDVPKLIPLKTDERPGEGSIL